jgi:hypothetical protein
VQGLEAPLRNREVRAIAPRQGGAPGGCHELQQAWGVGGSGDGGARQASWRGASSRASGGCRGSSASGSASGRRSRSAGVSQRTRRGRRCGGCQSAVASLWHSSAFQRVSLWRRLSHERVFGASWRRRSVSGQHESSRGQRGGACQIVSPRSSVTLWRRSVAHESGGGCGCGCGCGCGFGCGCGCGKTSGSEGERAYIISRGRGLSSQRGGGLWRSVSRRRLEARGQAGEGVADAGRSGPVEDNYCTATLTIAS